MGTMAVWQMGKSLMAAHRGAGCSRHIVSTPNARPLAFVCLTCPLASPHPISPPPAHPFRSTSNLPPPSRATHWWSDSPGLRRSCEWCSRVSLGEGACRDGVGGGGETEPSGACSQVSLGEGACRDGVGGVGVETEPSCAAWRCLALGACTAAHGCRINRSR